MPRLLAEFIVVLVVVFAEQSVNVRRGVAATASRMRPAVNDSGRRMQRQSGPPKRKGWLPALQSAFANATYMSEMNSVTNSGGT